MRLSISASILLHDSPSSHVVWPLYKHTAMPAPGGYAVLKGVQAGMQLPNKVMLPSFASLRDFGNTSCSTTW